MLFEKNISNPRLKISSMRIPIGLGHNKFSIYQELLSSADLPKNTRTVISLLESCTKSGSTNVLKAKGLKTTDKLRRIFTRPITNPLGESLG
ncbi:hypothetical protein TNCV_4923521 [Trichonephila clavipes]|nr:hypothetical protein TNCV_4923521 [Trichonephila clavipes]